MQAAASVSEAYIQDQCRKWCNRCIEEVNLSIDKLLHFVNCVKRLADIRDDVWLMLSQDENYETWRVVCETVLTSPLNIWSSFLQSLFVHRIQALITYQLESAAEVTKRHITKVVMENSANSDSPEHDMSTYIWSESSSDIPPTLAWQSSSTKTLMSGGGLMMKTWAFTPAIQSLCGSFDEKLAELIADVCHYLKSDDKQPTEEGPFNKFSNDGTLIKHLQTASIACIKQVVEYIQEQLSLWEKALDQIKEPQICQLTINKVLLAGRFCTACTELTFHLSQCILGPGHKEARHVKHSLHRKTSKIKDDGPWTDITNLLSETSLDAYRIWMEHTTQSLLEQYSTDVLSTGCRDVLLSFTQWEDVEISEDTEEGKSITSTIRVPMQASWCLQQCLYNACRHINQVGGHTLHRSVLQSLVHKLTDGILATVTHLCTNEQQTTKLQTTNQQTMLSGCLPLTQQRALQLMFDVKFLMQIIPRKEDLKVNKSYQESGRRLIEILEDHIDPFDLDVFSPYIQTNLNKQSRRSLIVYGGVMSLDKHSLHGHMTTSHTEQHNILPLSSSAPRFPLLPLSTDTSRPSFTHHLLPTKLPKVPDAPSGQSLAESAAAVIESVTANTSSAATDGVGSFYNRIGSMSQIWFSNIGTKS